MSTTIEIRRHSARHHDDWGHLTQQGVELARRVGSTMGSFDTVITSPLPRAAETAIAMGYGIDRELHELAVVGEDVDEELDWPIDFPEFVRRMQPGTAMAQRGAELASLLQSIAVALDDGSAALLLSHGAVIEMAVVATTPDVDHTAWGKHCDYCEGVRITYRDGRAIAAEILRVERAGGQ